MQKHPTTIIPNNYSVKSSFNWSFERQFNATLIDNNYKNEKQY